MSRGRAGGGAGEPLAAAEGAASFGIVLTSSTAYRSRAARQFLASLKPRLALTEPLAGRLETALHEAIMNALVHGNLGLSSHARDTLDDFVALEAAVERLLARPEMSRRKITISARWSDRDVELTVEDEGSGYTAAERPPDGAAYGRGLAIIRAEADHVHVDDGGRRVIMRFCR